MLWQKVLLRRSARLGHLDAPSRVSCTSLALLDEFVGEDVVGLRVGCVAAGACGCPNSRVLASSLAVSCTVGWPAAYEAQFAVEHYIDQKEESALCVNFTVRACFLQPGGLTDIFTLILHRPFALPSWASSVSGAIVEPSIARSTSSFRTTFPSVEPVAPWTILASIGSTMGVQGWEQTGQERITVWKSSCSWHTAQHSTQGHKTQESGRRHFSTTCAAGSTGCSTSFTYLYSVKVGAWGARAGHELNLALIWNCTTNHICHVYVHSRYMVVWKIDLNSPSPYLLLYNYIILASARQPYRFHRLWIFRLVVRL